MSSDDSFFREDAPPRPVDPEGLTPKLPPDPWQPAPPREDAIVSPGTLPGTSEPVTVVRLPAPPQPPHPNFGFALLWCLLFLTVTQVIPGVVTAVLGFLYFAARGQLQDANLLDKVQAVTTAPNVAATQILGILFSLLALRIVAGREWTRRVALRLPRLWQVAAVLLGFLPLAILASGAYLLAQNYLPGLKELPALLLAQLVVFPVAWLAVRLGAGDDWGQRLGRQPVSRQLLWVTLGVAAVGFALTAVYRLISPYVFTFPFDFGDLMGQMVQVFRSWPWGLAVLLVGLGPGLSEELFCRAFLGRGLVGNYGVVLGAVLTAYLFGLIHLEPHQASMAVLMGLVLHFAYLTTRSLLVPMLMHALNNSLSVLGDRLGESVGKIDAAPGRIDALIYALAGLVVLTIGWALYVGRARLRSVEGGPPPWEPAYPGVSHPPAGSDTVVARPWPGWLASGLVLAAFAAFAAVFYLAEAGRLPR
jgi:membrane protease YdiL (CAAX protease family)